MPRLPRLKIEGCGATYHLSARTSALRGEFPLRDPVMAEKLVELIRFYTAVYFCNVNAYICLGNHYHLILRFDEPREVEPDELDRRARYLYKGPAGQGKVDSWTPEKWQAFQARLFNVSELMRNIQGCFASWYNKLVDRRGHFWAERFNSVILADERAVLDCMLYVELNAFRAGLVERPEDWRFSSLHLREIGKADWLEPLVDIISAADETEALVEYRSLVYYRGAVPTKAGQAAISKELLEQEEKRGFATSGAFKRRLRHFSEGLVIGARTKILELIARRRQASAYPCRQQPIAKLDGVHWVFKDQHRQRSPT